MTFRDGARHLRSRHGPHVFPVQLGSPIQDDYETIPYFCLPSNHLAHGVIAESCRSCFDYPNALADLVVGYMGVPYYDVPMTRHPQYVTVRNDKGKEMIELVRARLQVVPTVSSGHRKVRKEFECSSMRLWLQ